MSLCASVRLTYSAPRATLRMAATSSPGECSLGRYPAAPEPNNRRAWGSSPSILSTSTRIVGRCVLSCQSSATVPGPATDMSKSSTSASAARTLATSSGRLVTSPTTHMSGHWARMRFHPSSTTGRSSARNSLIMGLEVPSSRKRKAPSSRIAGATEPMPATRMSSVHPSHAGVPESRRSGKTRHVGVVRRRKIPYARSPLLDLEQPGAEREADQLGSMLEAQLPHDACAIGLHGLGAHAELLADLVRGMARGRQRKDFPLARAEACHGEVRLASWRPPGALNAGFRDGAIDKHLVLHHAADGMGQVVGAAHLVHVAAAARLEDLEEYLFLGLAREHEDLGAPLLPGDAAQGLEPPHPRHDEVHDHHIRLECAGLLDRLFTRGGLTDDVQTGLGIEQLAEPRTEHRVVVCQKDLDRVGRGRRRPCLWLFH